MKSFQTWPSKGELTAKWLMENVQTTLRIDKASRIISIGSCFAREIKYWLKKRQFNYLEGETGKYPWVSREVFKGDRGRPPTDHASIAWERVYNTFTFEQILRYTFEEARMQERLIKVSIGDKEYVADLLRTRILYPDLYTAEEDILDHIAQSRSMFSSAEILIVTLGLTEIWRSDVRDMVIPSHPGKHYTIPEDFYFHESTYEENLSCLRRCVEVLVANNPTLKILLTVSPVHLLATFRTDVDVVSASCASKSTLRCVADALGKQQGVYYFPSYEIATIYCPIRKIVVYPDNHHVSKRVVDTIMDVFAQVMISDGVR